MSVRKIKAMGVVLAMILLTAGSLFAQTITLPYTFSAGTTAVASQVNADFSKLATSLPGVRSYMNPSGSSFVSISGSDVTMKNMASISLTVPGAGYVIVTLTGYAVFMGDNRTVAVGVGSSTTSFVNSVQIGRLDGSGTLRFNQDYTAECVVSVGAAGTYTYYALAQGNTTFASNSVNVVPSALTGIYVPTQY